MKLKDSNTWKAVRFSDRTILREDLKYMDPEQVKSLLNLEVLPDGIKDRYKVSTLCTNLNKIRAERGISQAKLAEISGVSARMIPKYESGQNDINKAQALTVYSLAQALGVKVEDLLEK